MSNNNSSATEAVDQAPIAQNDTYNSNEGTTLNIGGSGVLGNDTDPNTPALTLSASLVTGPSHGTLTLNSNGSFNYVPTTGYSGTDTFTYRDFDGTIYSNNNATVTLDIAHVAPVSNAVIVNGTEGQVASGSINATDAITTAVLTPSVVTAPAHGTVVLNANGTFTYTPATGYSGTDTFTYEVNDGTVNSNIAAVDPEHRPCRSRS